MDAYKAIIGKRDRRDYDGRPIPDDVMQRILQAGRMAGSSSNTQPIRFIVLRDAAQKQAMAPAGPGTAPLVNAPLSIVIVLKKGSRDFDVGRAAQNMMVAAWVEGVHSCPIGLRQTEVSKAVLGLPDDYEAAIGVSFGYPAAAPSGNVTERAPSPRLPLEDLVHYERW